MSIFETRVARLTMGLIFILMGIGILIHGGVTISRFPGVVITGWRAIVIGLLKSMIGLYLIALGIRNKKSNNV